MALPVELESEHPISRAHSAIKAPHAGVTAVRFDDPFIGPLYEHPSWGVSTEAATRDART
jgi:hypothetical protein